MRGDGSVFLRGRIWWIAYSWRGHLHQESAKSADKKVALKLLRKRIKEVEKPRFVDPAKEQRYTLPDMKEVIRLDYVRRKNRSFESVEYAFKHLEEGFKFHRVIDITDEKITAYGDNRLSSGAERASVNRELAYLRRGFNLMLEQKMISSVPTIKLYQGENIRKGFIDIAEFNVLLEKIADADVGDLVKFLYHSAWRSGEAMALQWSWIDGDMIRLPAEVAKGKKARALPIVEEILDVIERRKQVRRLDCAFIFHRNGRPIKSFRKAFKAAAKKIGFEGLLPHDMRRSGVRNFRKSGLSESEGMALSGHKTNAVYKRYDIISDDDLTQSMKRVQEHLKNLVQNQKVVPLKRETA